MGLKVGDVVLYAGNNNNLKYLYQDLAGVIKCRSMCKRVFQVQFNGFKDLVAFESSELRLVKAIVKDKLNKLNRKYSEEMTYGAESLVNSINTTSPTCICGVESAGVGGVHSDWCEKFEEGKLK